MLYSLRPIFEENIAQASMRSRQRNQVGVPMDVEEQKGISKPMQLGTESFPQIQQIGEEGDLECWSRKRRGEPVFVSQPSLTFEVPEAFDVA
jgi:hypothetical protein